MKIRLIILTVALCLLSVLAHSEESNYFKEQLEKAKAGDAEAQTKIGEMYATGQGVTQNYQKAIEWSLKSAEQGDASAQTMLGALYYDGIAVLQNYEKAFEWFQKTAVAAYDTGFMWVAVRNSIPGHSVPLSRLIIPLSRPNHNSMYRTPLRFFHHWSMA